MKKKKGEKEKKRKKESFKFGLLFLFLVLAFQLSWLSIFSCVTHSRAAEAFARRIRTIIIEEVQSEGLIIVI